MEQARDRGCKPTACHSVDDDTHAVCACHHNAVFVGQRVKHTHSTWVCATFCLRLSHTWKPDAYAQERARALSQACGQTRKRAHELVQLAHICDRERQKKNTSAFDAPCPPSSSEAVAASSQATQPLRLSLSRPHPSLARIQGSCGHRKGEHNRVARGGLHVNFGKACRHKQTARARTRQQRTPRATAPRGVGLAEQRRRTYTL